jgi:hypothetical protein
VEDDINFQFCINSVAIPSVLINNYKLGMKEILEHHVISLLNDIYNKKLQDMDIPETIHISLLIDDKPVFNRLKIDDDDEDTKYK